MEHHNLVPNQAMELVIPFLSNFFPVLLATKLFLSLGLLLIASGVTTLHLVLHRRLSWWPLLVFLFLFSRYMLWGFLGYFFSIGCALWVAVLWIVFRQKKYWMRLLFFSLSASLLYFLHLMAFGVYALFVIGYEFGEFLTNKERPQKQLFLDAAISLSQFVIGGLFFILRPKIVNPNLQSDFASLYSLSSKVGGIFGITWNYIPVADIALFVLLFGTALFLFVTKRLFIHSEVKWSLILLTVAFFLLPSHLSGSSYLDKRIPIVILFILIASISFKAGKVSWKTKTVIVALFFIIFLFRTSILYINWAFANDYYTKCIQALELVPRGARIYTATKPTGKHSEFPPARHIATYAIITREAFVQDLFAFPRYGVSIALTEEYEKIVRAEPRHMYLKHQTPNWDVILEHYDYVFLVNPQLFEPIPDMFNETIKGNGFSLYLIKRD